MIFGFGIHLESFASHVLHPFSIQSESNQSTKQEHIDSVISTTYMVLMMKHSSRLVTLGVLLCLMYAAEPLFGPDADSLSSALEARYNAARQGDDGNDANNSSSNSTQQNDTTSDNDTGDDSSSELDSDGDGFNDTHEIECGSSANDNNSIPSHFDFDLDTICDALDDDDDGDGASDEEELICGSDPLNTSFTPLSTDFDGDGQCAGRDVDSDGDGWTDEWEVACGTDPLDEDFRPLDKDGDGVCSLYDSQEVLQQTSSGRSRRVSAPAFNDAGPTLLNRMISIAFHPMTGILVLVLLFTSSQWGPMITRARDRKF